MIPNGPTTPRRIDLIPSRSDLIDAAFLLVLSVLALIGFRSTYVGQSYLLVGVAGVLLGLFIGHLANALNQPLITVAAMAVGVFFLLGGAVAVRAHTVAGVIPTGRTLTGLASVSVDGWKQLLTTLPPVDSGGPLLAIPYILGLLAGAGGFTMARRLTQPTAPILAPALVLAAVILLGTTAPAAQLLQGAGFAIVALTWACSRSLRRRPPVQNGSGRRTQLVTAAALIGLTAVGAVYAGPHLPGGAHRRVVLRSYVTPPFDLNAYPSPLVGFRRYTPDAKIDTDSVLFTVTPKALPANAFIRIATLDSYNLSVWGATNDLQAQPIGQPADTFQRVGSQIATTAKGTPVKFTVTIGGAYAASNDVNAWLPTTGTMTSIHFSGPRSAAQANGFRYNLATNQGIVPARLVTGDSYTITAMVSTPTLPAQAEPYGSPTLPSSADAFTSAVAAQWAKGATGGVVAQVMKVADYLQQKGYYSDGGPQQDQSKPGHSFARLSEFMTGVPVGDDEQYAATFALMSNALGLPARVVLGAVPETSGSVKGADVHTWVEVHLSDGTWVPIPRTIFMPNTQKTPNKQPPQQQQTAQSKIVPPPNIAKHPTGADAAVGNPTPQTTLPRKTQKATVPFHLPGYLTAAARWAGPPIVVILLFFATVLMAKMVRRRRRRNRGPASTRVSKGWRELVDHARDLGATAPTGRTRREQAHGLAEQGIEPLAAAADASVFGPGEIGESTAAEYWARVDQARKDMSRRVGRWRRLRAAVSVRSLRRLPTAEPGATT